MTTLLTTSADPGSSAPRSLPPGSTTRRPPKARRIIFYAFLAALIYCAAVLLEGLLLRLPPVTSGTPAPGERIGVVHIHTQASDGSGTVDSVMAAGRSVGLSFMAITDHNVSMTPEAMALDPPDLPDISGEELTTNSGHVLALGIPPGWQRPATKNAQALLDAIHQAGGFAVVAHPFHTHIPWTYWNTSDFDGMEIVNEDELWRRDRWIDLVDSVLVYGINDQLALVRLARRPEQNFAKWDSLLAERPVVGTCGADAHANIRIGHSHSLHFPGYASVFTATREHVLLPSGPGTDPARASGADILDALRHGHAFCALDALYPAAGFTAEVSRGAVSAGPGDTITLPAGGGTQPAGGGTIQVKVPSGAPRPLVRVIHNGKVMTEQEGWAVSAPLEGPGFYRTEVYLRQPGLFGFGRWALWIFSNPTYATSADTRESLPPDPAH